MKLIFAILFIISFQGVCQNDITHYLNEYGRTGVSDYKSEQDIIKNNNLENLIKNLAPFYGDTLVHVRQKAYYLTYKKAIGSDVNRVLAVNILLNGCNAKDGGIIGQNLEFLKNFHSEDFGEKSIQHINSKLLNHKIKHYKDFVLLAGFIGTGKDILYQKLLDTSVPNNAKWSISLALARMGNNEQINNCIDKIRKLPVNDNLLDYVIPDLIYMRQKEGIDYCINILNNDEKLCHSLNPDISESIICGYRILEMLAPIVVDIPVVIDATGFISANNYENMLSNIRKWFNDNPNYIIRKNVY